MLLLGTAAVALAVPTVSLAGKAVTSGDQSLQLGVQLSPTTPATPGKGGVSFRMKVDYKSLNEGAQIKEATKSVTLTLPKGMRIHPERAPACLVSAAIGDAGEDACPKGSRIGGGTGTVDVRPAIPTPLDAEIHVYNAMDDTMPDGSPRDPAIPAVMLYAKTMIGVSSVIPFDIDGNTLRLDFAPLPEGQSQEFHIETVKFAVPLRKGKAYFTRPGRCPAGFWGFRMTIENFDGPSVTAGHRVPCSQG